MITAILWFIVFSGIVSGITQMCSSDCNCNNKKEEDDYENFI